ncbi:HlyD family efflux transporter periplasmic adaptor subunit [Microbacterium fluvii]|uniref:HlyD family efflux transporter periplasmic adaptor subunit n=1 Tax=Microbacterium fluvii TaxID=415215 RepID=A0ABW2HCG7_9MICO|nr:HlyD family secretion protein [Microbacterium fluvii]MCU4672384.1 HlyD family secretion protein [Microbacterium fluvii]
MTWAGRIRLAVGLLVVFAVVGACTLVFTQRQTRADSVSAAMTADAFSLGSVYAGTVVDQNVSAGDTVAQGDTLFTVRSPQLARDLEQKAITADDLGVPVDDDGTYEVVASVDGVVAEVLAPAGDFVQAGELLATIDQAGSLAVAAQFQLTARDYGRVEAGSTVELLLPDNRRISGRVAEIDVETDSGSARSTIVVESPALAAHAIGGLYQPGTPVTATLQLRDDGPLAGITDAFGDFVRKIGL